MTKRLFYAAVCLSIMQSNFSFMQSNGLHAARSFANHRTTASIQWQTDYHQALRVSRESNKPMFLFFTGSDWCTWCHKFEREILEKKEFVETLGDRFVFVMLDFPRSNHLPKEESLQNQRLQKKYGVRGFPSVVLLDADEQLIAQTGYREGGPGKYQEHLVSLLDAHAGSMHQFASDQEVTQDTFVSVLNVSEQLLEAKKFPEAKAFLENRLGLDENHALLCQLYLAELFLGNGLDPRVRHMKQTLLAFDRENVYGYHKKIAVGEFTHLFSQKELGKNFADAQQLTEPLKVYLEAFGATDATSWALEKTIAKLYLQEQNYTLAAQWAQKALSHAPESMMASIQSLHASIEKEIAALDPSSVSEKEVAQSQ